MGLFWKTKESEFAFDVATLGNETIANSYGIALSSCADFIAKAISSCEFITFEKNFEVKADNYYLLNMQPNFYQNGVKFWYDVIYTMMTKGECLVVVKKSTQSLHVADSFVFDELTDVFSHVYIRNKPENRVYRHSDVWHFSLADTSLYKNLHAVMKTFGDVFNSAIQSYKKRNGSKWILKIKSALSQTNSASDEKDKLINSLLRKFMDNDNATLPLSDGYSLEDKSYSTVKNSDDIVALNLEILKLVCIALHVPINILLGNTVASKEQITNLLTFCIDPISEMIACEVNRKYFDKAGYLAGDFMKVDTSRVMHRDILEKANSLDILFRIGFSHNDLRKILGSPKLQEDWADIHYVTKNYMDMKSIEGGGEGEE